MLGGIFHFYSNSNTCRKFREKTVEILIRRRVNAASGLGLHCLPMSHKKDARLIWVKSWHPHPKGRNKNFFFTILQLRLKYFVIKII